MKHVAVQYMLKDQGMKHIAVQYMRSSTRKPSVRSM